MGGCGDKPLSLRMPHGSTRGDVLLELDGMRRGGGGERFDRSTIVLFVREDSSCSLLQILEVILKREIASRNLIYRIDNIFELYLSLKVRIYNASPF